MQQILKRMLRWIIVDEITTYMPLFPLFQVSLFYIVMSNSIWDWINIPFMHLQTAEIERRIEQETKAEKHIQKLLLLGE